MQKIDCHRTSKITARLTVYFADPFWMGLYERVENGHLEAARIVFGPEPKSYQVYEYFNQNWQHLKFSPAVKEEPNSHGRINPKRLQREIQRQLKQDKPAGTKSQQALKLLQEENKQERKQKRKQRKEEEKERQFQMKQQKKKEKHRGH